MQPLAVEGGKLTLYVEPGVRGGGRGRDAAADRRHPADHHAEPVVGRQTERNFFSPRLAWAGGRVFLLNERVRSPKGDEKDNSMLSFGK